MFLSVLAGTFLGGSLAWLFAKVVKRAVKDQDVVVLLLVVYCFLMLILTPVLARSIHNDACSKVAEPATELIFYLPD
jgi:ABC-type uncharacterized transport system permease subunit